jgi:hypothetical protein
VSRLPGSARAHEAGAVRLLRVIICSARYSIMDIMRQAVSLFYNSLASQRWFTRCICRLWDRNQCISWRKTGGFPRCTGTPTTPRPARRIYMHI